MSQEEKRPTLIVAHGDFAYAALAYRTFRRLGWDVQRAESGPEVRQLAHRLEPRFVILDRLYQRERLADVR